MIIYIATLCVDTIRTIQMQLAQYEGGARHHGIEAYAVTVKRSNYNH